MTVLQSCAAVHLHRLSIRDFRNIAQAEVEAPRAGFVLVGDNGQGKTNLLEAIYYLHLFRWPRTSTGRRTTSSARDSSARPGASGSCSTAWSARD